MKILVADDDPSTRQMLMALLGKWGYGIVPTSNGEEAWQVLQHDTTIRIALLDWFMPEMTGVDLIRRIRARNIAPFHAILLTARGGKESMLSALEAGADDFISKPFDKDMLQARLKVAVRLVELQSYLVQRVMDAEAAAQGFAVLKRFVAACSVCGRVRDLQDQWHKLDLPFAQNTGETEFQVCCPVCTVRIAKVAAA